jgi:fructokinase
MFLVCGEALFDLISIREDPIGERRFAGFPGGSPLNLAIGLRRLGESVSFVGGLSSDGFGADLRATLEREKIDFSRARTNNLPTPIELASTGHDGQPFYSFYTKGCAHLDFGLEALASARDDGFSAIALGSFLLDDETIGEMLVRSVRDISDEVVVSFDPNVRRGVISNMQNWLSRFHEIAKCATIIKASDEDIAALWCGEMTPRQQSTIWLNRGCPLVIITLGSLGATVFHVSGEVFVPALAADVVDTIGAGDAFHAGFLAGISRRKLLDASSIRALKSETILRIGLEAAAAASINCSRPGANPPTFEELRGVVNLDSNSSP